MGLFFTSPFPKCSQIAPCGSAPIKKPFQNSILDGGSGEIRTHGRVSPSTVFKTVAFNRSATLPAIAGGNLTRTQHAVKLCVLALYLPLL